MPGISVSRRRPAAPWASSSRRGIEARRPARVGMAGPVEQLIDVRLLDLLARIHDHDPLGDLGDHAQIVRDQHDGVPSLSCSSCSSSQDLRLDRDVERRGRLVGDQQSRIAGQRHRDHHPLAHAAGQLVRIVAQPPLGVGDADQLEQVDRRVARACARSAPGAA